MPISRARHRSCRPLELRGCRICSAPRSQPGAVCTSAPPRQLCQCLCTAVVRHSRFRGRPCLCCLAPVCSPAWHSQRRWPDPSPQRSPRRRALRARRPCRQPPPIGLKKVRGKKKTRFHPIQPPAGAEHASVPLPNTVPLACALDFCAPQACRWSERQRPRGFAARPELPLQPMFCSAASM